MYKDAFLNKKFRLCTQKRVVPSLEAKLGDVTSCTRNTIKVPWRVGSKKRCKTDVEKIVESGRKRAEPKPPNDQNQVPKRQEKENTRKNSGHLRISSLGKLPRSPKM